MCRFNLEFMGNGHEFGQAFVLVLVVFFSLHSKFNWMNLVCFSGKVMYMLTMCPNTFFPKRLTLFIYSFFVNSIYSLTLACSNSVTHDMRSSLFSLVHVTLCCSYTQIHNNNNKENTKSVVHNEYA